jgi:hypothetical protein
VARPNKPPFEYFYGWARHLRAKQLSRQSQSARRRGIERSGREAISRTRPHWLIFKLAQAAEKSCHRLRGHDQLPKVILGLKFNNKTEVVKSQAQAAFRLTSLVTKIWRKLAAHHLYLKSFF